MTDTLSDRATALLEESDALADLSPTDAALVLAMALGAAQERAGLADGDTRAARVAGACYEHHGGQGCRACASGSR
jgi:hypothetical protein